jgi:hypothetical protein
VKRLIWLVLLILIAMGLVWLPGCDKETTSSQLKKGDTTDAGFQVMKELLGDGVMGQDQGMINIALELTNQIPGALTPLSAPFKHSAAGDSIVVYSYIYAQYWHVFACSVFVSSNNDFFLFTGVDSLRFANANGLVRYPDSTVTAMNIRYHFLVAAELGASSAWMNDHGSWDITGEWGNFMSIDGHSADTVDFHLVKNDTAYCNIEMNVGQTINHLYLDSVALDDKGCPPSGSISMTSMLTMECVNVPNADSLNVEGHWTASFTFRDPNMTAVFSNGTTLWTVTEECRESGGAGKMGLLKMIETLRDLKE